MVVSGFGGEEVVAAPLHSPFILEAVLGRIWLPLNSFLSKNLSSAVKADRHM